MNFKTNRKKVGFSNVEGSASTGDLVLDGISTRLATANENLIAAVNYAVQIAAERNECQRQVNYHLSLGDQENANIASATCLAPANNKADAAESDKLAAAAIVKDLKAEYEAALQAYNSRNNTNAQLKAQNDAVIINAQAALEAAKPKFYKTTAGVILISSVGLAFVGVAVKLIFFNKKKGA